MTTDQRDPRQELRDLEQQHQALEHEEYIRAIEAQRPERERQRIESGIHQTALEVAEQDLQAGIQRNRQLIAENNQAADTLEQALNIAADNLQNLFKAISPTARRVDEAFATQQQHASRTRSSLRDALFQHGDYNTSPMDGGNERQLSVGRDVNQRADLPDAVPLDLLVRSWISQEKNHSKRRLRSAIGYALIGVLDEPDQPINRDQMRLVVRQRRQTRRSF